VIGDAMDIERLVVRSVEVRPVLVPLKRPIVSTVGAFPTGR